jgi:hypothetical protein
VKAKHTPGPWRITEGHRDRIIRAIDSDGDDTVIAEVHWWAMAGAAESIANARLIAAAPELLEACKFAFAAMNSEDGRKRAEQALIAAIAKAEGRS